MSVAICPHCAAVQRQPAEAGSVVQCEACHKSFTVGESVNPAVTQPPVSAPAAPVKHIPTGYGGGILIAKIVAAMGWLFAAAGIFIMLSSIGARYGTAMLVFFYGAGTLLAGMMTVLLARRSCVIRITPAHYWNAIRTAKKEAPTGAFFMTVPPWRG